MDRVERLEQGRIGGDVGGAGAWFGYIGRTDVKEDVDLIAVVEKRVDEVVENGMTDGGLGEGTKMAGDADGNASLGGAVCGWGIRIL